MVRWLATKLVKENELEEILKEFPSRLEPSNRLYRLLPNVINLRSNINS
jgi:hypothetical protein